MLLTGLHFLEPFCWPQFNQGINSYPVLEEAKSSLIVLGRHLYIQRFSSQTGFYQCVALVHTPFSCATRSTVHLPPHLNNHKLQKKLLSSYMVLSCILGSTFHVH